MSWLTTRFSGRWHRDLTVEWCELDDLFARSDVISLHCPLTPQTAGLVNRERLEKMKPTAFLINTARGPLVVDADLAQALDAGTARRCSGRRRFGRADPTG